MGLHEPRHYPLAKGYRAPCWKAPSNLGSCLRLETAQQGLPSHSRLWTCQKPSGHQHTRIVEANVCAGLGHPEGEIPRTPTGAPGRGERKWSRWESNPLYRTGTPRSVVGFSWTPRPDCPFGEPPTPPFGNVGLEEKEERLVILPHHQIQHEPLTLACHR